MTALSELQPGDVVTQAGRQGIYVAQVRHPLWQQLQLVVWMLDDGTWSHDALDPRQDVGQVLPATAEQRRIRLRQALLPGSLL